VASHFGSHRWGHRLKFGLGVLGAGKTAIVVIVIWLSLSDSSHWDIVLVSISVDMRSDTNEDGRTDVEKQLRVIPGATLHGMWCKNRVSCATPR